MTAGKRSAFLPPTRGRLFAVLEPSAEDTCVRQLLATWHRDKKDRRPRIGQLAVHLPIRQSHLAPRSHQEPARVFGTTGPLCYADSVDAFELMAPSANCRSAVNMLQRYGSLKEGGRETRSLVTLVTLWGSWPKSSVLNSPQTFQRDAVRLSRESSGS
jgi:hypothetical protein